MPEDSPRLAENLIGGRYRILSQLAGGSGSSTRKVLDTHEDRVCILKTLHLESLGQWKRLDLFKREARTLAHLDHPQIPALLDYFEEQAEPRFDCHLVTERVPGRTLAHRLQAGLHFSEPEAYQIAVQVLGILKYLHRFTPPVVHRDIKPSNLILDDGGTLFLIDFGGVQEALGGGGSTMIGTYGYMAPEQFAGRALPQSDLYGLGATLVYLLSGREPANLPAQDLLLAFRPYVECSERFANWIEHLLQPAFERRFATAAEALEVLRDVLPAYHDLSLTALQKADAARRQTPLVDWARLEKAHLLPEAVSTVPAGQLLPAGELLEGRYRIEGVLGQGDIAITYAARREAADGASDGVVIRELHFDKLTNWKSYELFERELRILSQLRHAALPRVVEHFELRQADRHRFYLVSERIDGETLEARLRQGWRPTEKEVREIADQLLLILEFLQDQDPPLIHRDIKPSNLLIDAAGKIHLIDFGAVQEAFRLQGGGGSTVIGTYGYMAPEQCVGRAVPASDLYGVGATLIHLLSGRSPSQLGHQGLRIQFAEQVRCSRQLFSWLEKMVEPNLKLRYDSPWIAREQLQKLDQMPVMSKELLAQASRLIGPHEPAIAIYEDIEGLHLNLKPMYHDYKLLLPLLFGGNLAFVPLLFALAGPFAFLGILLPLLSGVALFSLREKCQGYETEITIDAERLRYAVRRRLHPEQPETELIEQFEYPTPSVIDVFLADYEVNNLLCLRLNFPDQAHALRRVTRYPLAADRKKAEHLLERMRETLFYYRRQQSLLDG